jgi:hypothetical protein
VLGRLAWGWRNGLPWWAVQDLPAVALGRFGGGASWHGGGRGTGGVWCPATVQQLGGREFCAVDLAAASSGGDHRRPALLLVAG